MVEEKRWIYKWKTSKPLGDWWRKNKRSRWLVENISWLMSKRKTRKIGGNQKVQKNRKIKLWSRAERSGDHVTVGIFCLLSRQGQKRDKKQEVQVFLVRLLAPLFFAGLPCFCLMLETSALGLTLSLTISEAEFISGEVAVDFSG